MTKEELIHITLKQLSESLKITPENFRLEDASIGLTTSGSSFPGPTIVWQHRVKIDEDKFIQDPLNSVKTIIVTYNKINKQLQCYIYNREVNNLNHAIMAEAQVSITYPDLIPTVFYRTHRQFMTLREELIRQKNQKEYIDYLRRLNGIFPATHEDEIFK
jgi:hypothetical protein